MRCIPTFLLASFSCFLSAWSAEPPRPPLQPTMLGTRQELLVDQEFQAPLPPFDGKSNGFASGFKAWRYNSAARGGHWEVVNGAFHGSESIDPKVKHPATASYGFEFKDVIIECDVRMLDVPLNGRAARYVQVRTTDTKDYVCSLVLKPDGMRIEKSDNDHGGPDKPLTLAEHKRSYKLGEWQHILIEIVGEEMHASVNNSAFMSGKHPLIASQKHSIMFVSGGDSEVRHFKVWSAGKNPSWENHRKQPKLQAGPSISQ